MMIADAERLLSQAVSRQTDGDVEAALTLYRRALSLDPAHGRGWSFSSHASHGKGLTLRAARLAERAIAIDPHQPLAHALRGFAAMQQARASEATFWLRRAVALAPGYVLALSNLAASLEQTDGPPGVARWAMRAVAVDPAFPQARLNRANAWLALGRWREAWPDHELRLFLQDAYPHAPARPRWTGETLPGATLLVHDEIGYGDVFNYARYLPMARARVGRLILEVKPGLARLYQGYPGIDQLLERSAAPPAIAHDVCLPLESLPGVFGTIPANVPPDEPAPAPPAAAIERWRAELVLSSPRLRVGLVWAGSAGSGLDAARSCRLADLAPLGAVGGIEWISLQRGPTTAQLAAFPLPIADIGSTVEDFADTAAVILQLDAVVTVDTSVAHLAAALGRPTLILLSRWPAWRWLLDRTDSPWYRTAELYRQRRPGEWSRPVGEIAARLAALRAAKVAA